MPTVMMGDLNEWTAASGCLRDFGRDFAMPPPAPASTPADDRAARPDHGVAPDAYGRLRRPHQPGGTDSVRSPADLGDARTGMICRYKEMMERGSQGAAHGPERLIVRERNCVWR